MGFPVFLGKYKHPRKKKPSLIYSLNQHLMNVKQKAKHMGHKNKEEKPFEELAVWEANV